ncbi:TonB-dependent receptor plug domain-containing protein [Marinicella gelatinilytica]|uniref:TonB-dependent receptor plug domain-containing protein n=1 Tax=Marinicella gelatinilytica TaxID=2996017 RepID=UPI002260AA0B|nr:TonB-dependent receptor [Marinicella gelatinilytica]MCX7544120.1 TonB-dependent receptor [Marinicella gelatinilytica]
MKMKRNPITNAVYKALMTGFVASSALGTVALAQDNDEDQGVEEQGKITVTGSRIKRSDVEGALPVTVITREQIELSGESTAADFLRNMTFNSAGSLRPASGSSAQAEASLNLRGIGASRTLVLIDGRRMAKAPGTGSTQDLNTIPMGAVERIEVLSDGASAVYGSDAIGGVVNIITRDDYEGAEIMIGGEEVSIPENGGDSEMGSILFGAAGDRSNITVGMSWNDREIIFARDLPWSAGTGASLFGNNFSLVDPDTGELTFSFLPVNEDACNFEGTGFFTAGGGLCRYDFTTVSADEASISNRSLFTRSSYEINDDWELYADASYAKTESFGRYAPVPEGRYLNNPLNPIFESITPTSPNNPTNPNSPLYNPDLGLAPQPVDWWHRFDAVGPRDSTVGTSLTDVVLGTLGTIGNAEVEFGIRNTNNVRTDTGRNYLYKPAALRLIESGEYQLWDPFSPQSQAALNEMRITIFRESKYDQSEIFGNVAFDIFDMANGPASMVIGAEYREEKYLDQYDPLSEAGLIGGSAGNSAGGNRDVTSLFAEVLFPVLDNLELNLAGRYDDYSDFGSEFSPKASLRWQPLDTLTVRASYGQGFRAPTLDILTSKPAFSADSVRDAATCTVQIGDPDEPCQINALVVANQNLTAETSDQFAVGLAYEPVDWFNMSVDYYDIEIEDRIRSFSSQDLVNYPDRAPVGLGCERDSQGLITQCVRGFANQGVYQVSGLDFNFRFNYDLLGGSISHNLQVSHMLDQKVSLIDGTLSDDLVKTPGLPEQRAQLMTQYAYGDFSIGYNINMIGDQNGDDDWAPVGTWVTHDVQLNYFAPWDGKFTIGVRNAGEKFPPIDQGFQDARDYDFNLYNGYGRVTYARYTQTF